MNPLDSDNFFENLRVIPCKKVRENEPAYLPTRREGDADFDLYASSDVVIQPGQIIPVPTNLAIEFPAGWEGKIEEKSGLALKKGVHVLGGVIDNIYTGEIIVIIKNQGLSNISFKPGEKVAQLQFRQCSPTGWSFAFTEKELKVTERGDKGFGSQGV
jgi:dUTP pyrophosphatase